MNEASRPGRRPANNGKDHDSRRGGRHGWRDYDPRFLSDDELLLIVRSMLAVDRAVDHYRGRRWTA
jgi:hypothetical protein